MVQESWLWDHGKVPIQDFSVSIHKTRGSEWSNRAYRRVSRESLCFPGKEEGFSVPAESSGAPAESSGYTLKYSGDLTCGHFRGRRSEAGEQKIRIACS